MVTESEGGLTKLIDDRQHSHIEKRKEPKITAKLKHRAEARDNSSDVIKIVVSYQY